MESSVIRHMAGLPNMVGRKFLASPALALSEIFGIAAFSGRMGHVEPGAKRNGSQRVPRLGGRTRRSLELRDGQPVMMAPERAAHALTKFQRKLR
jgi:hypothetical protein